MMDAVRAAAIAVDHPFSLSTTTTTTLASPAANTAVVSAITASLFLAAVSPLPTSAHDALPSSARQQEGECRLLGSFALLVQAALGALALLALVYKRWRERPQRPVKIWFFDVSKQVFGSVLVHVANVFMSMLTSGRFNITAVAVVSRETSVAAAAVASYIPNPCSFYLLNLGIDTTLGIPILIVFLHILTAVVALTPLGKPRESIQSGHYGDPPNAWWWLKQSVIYFCGLFLMKTCVLVIFIVMPWISKVGDWALGWTEGDEKLQIAFVMMIFPLIMNALQYYIIDSFIKKPMTEVDASDHDRGQFTPLRGRDSQEILDSDDGDADDERPLATKASAVPSTDDMKKAGQSSAPIEEYDSDLDRAVQVTASSGSSRRRVTASNPVTTNLLPKE